MKKWFNMHLKYGLYIYRHKLFVFFAGLVTGAPLWRLMIHDWTKLLPCEWVPYAEFFYGTKKSTEWYDLQARFGIAELAPWGESVQDLFTAAWLHHIHWNKHHWNYYVIAKDDGDPFAIPMPEKYVREMVADWLGAGKAIYGKWGAAEWYEARKDKILLHPETRKRVEALLAEATLELKTRKQRAVHQGD